MFLYKKRQKRVKNTSKNFFLQHYSCPTTDWRDYYSSSLDHRMLL